MSDSLRLRAGSASDLGRYVALQLDRMFPAEGLDADLERLLLVLEEALYRLRPILAAVRSFAADSFDHFHSLQYCAFLYLLANSYRKVSLTDGLADRLFCLNRGLNSIDLYHAVELPEVFFISHGLGSVLGAASYAGDLVVFQNVTVGRVGDDRPRLGAGIILFPGCSVTGRSIVGDGCVIAAGVQVHNVTVPADSVVFPDGRGVALAPRRKDMLGLYLRRS